MMNKRHVLLTALVLLALPLAGCAEPETDPGTTPPPGNGDPTNGEPTNGEPTNGAQHYVVGTDCAYPPFEDMVDGECVGYDMDVIQEIAERNGWTIEVQNVGFDLLIPSLQNQQVDIVISAMTIRPDRAEAVDFSLPYYVSTHQAVTKRADDTRNWESLEELAGLRAGVQMFTTAEGILEDDHPDIEVVGYDTYPLALAALRAGEVDVVVMDATAQERAVATDGEIEIAFRFESYEEYGIAIAQGRTALLNAINDALEEMEDDGTLEGLQEEWGI